MRGAPATDRSFDHASRRVRHTARGPRARGRPRVPRAPAALVLDGVRAGALDGASLAVWRGEVVLVAASPVAAAALEACARAAVRPERGVVHRRAPLVPTTPALPHVGERAPDRGGGLVVLRCLAGGDGAPTAQSALHAAALACDGAAVLYVLAGADADQAWAVLRAVRARAPARLLHVRGGRVVPP